MNAITTTHGAVCVGDKYHRSYGMGTAEVVGITETTVELEFSYEFNVERERLIFTIEDFLRMEAKSIEAGARFEPAPPPALDATAAGRTQ